MQNKNHSYKHNEQINIQNIDNAECFGVKFANIYPEMTSQYVFEKNMVLVDYIGIVLHVAILLTTYCRCKMINIQAGGFYTYNYQAIIFFFFSFQLKSLFEIFTFVSERNIDSYFVVSELSEFSNRGS